MPCDFHAVCAALFRLARRLAELGEAVPTRDDDGGGVAGDDVGAAWVELNADVAAEAARAAERRTREAQRRRVEVERARELRARDVERARVAEEAARAELRRREREEEERAAQRSREERERLELVRPRTHTKASTRAHAPRAHAPHAFGIVAARAGPRACARACAHGLRPGAR
jgi:hypothetical protein